MFSLGLGTGFGAVPDEDPPCLLEDWCQLDALGDSESEALSQASSSAQSGVTYEEKR